MFKTILILLLVFTFSAFADNIKQGSVSAAKTNIYAKPSSKSDIKGLLGRGEPVSILSEKSGWLKVKLTDGTGYIKSADVKKSDKKAEKKTDSGVKPLLEKFNRTVLASDYAEEKKIVPSLAFTEEKNPGELLLLYSAVDTEGNKIPSLLKNPLAKNMRELIEISFLKMLKNPQEEYRITVETPFFGEGGAVNGSLTYAVFSLKAEKEQIKAIEQGKISVWNLVKSSRKLADVFAEYPH